MDRAGAIADDPIRRPADPDRAIAREKNTAWSARFALAVVHGFA